MRHGKEKRARGKLGNYTEASENGEVSEAGELLGEAYFISEEVKEGARLGRTLDFPTINQIFGQKQLVPRNGVYHTLTLIDGKTYNSITNVGVKPTIEKIRIPWRKRIYLIIAEIFTEE